MKRLFAAFLIIMHETDSNSQSIWVGTKTPEASAVLDINSTDKGLLLPRVNLQSGIDKTTIPAPAPNLIVFNTNTTLNGGACLYYNAGTAASPNWKKLHDLTIPYYFGSTETNHVFRIDNYSPISSSTAIKGLGGGQGSGVWGEAGSGVGVYAKSLTGNALETNGKVKIAGTGQAPAQGKVLTSDANGNATWEGAVAFLAEGVTKQVIADGVGTKMLTQNLVYDLGGNYNNSTKVFTAPVAGIYHFDVHSQWASLTDDMLTRLDLIVSRNGVLTYSVADFLQINFNGMYGQEISIDYKLQAGDQVWPQVFQNSGDPQNVANFTAGDGGNRFGGRLVIKL